MSTLEDTANTSCAGPYSGNALNLGPYPTEKHFRETEIKSKAMWKRERERDQIKITHQGFHHDKQF
jgi:hypothetical protein